MGKNKDWNTPLTPEELKEIQKRLKGKGGSPGDVWKKIQASNRQPLMISHGEYFNEYGQPIQNPAFGIDRGGNPVHLPHMEQTPEEKIRNRKEHERKYHSDLTISKANNIRPGPKDNRYSEPEGTKFEKLYLKKKGWAKRLLNTTYA